MGGSDLYVGGFFSGDGDASVGPLGGIAKLSLSPYPSRLYLPLIVK